jgi:hypothetical protein
VTGNDAALGVDQDGIRPSKRPYRVSDLPDLLLGVGPGIPRVGFEGHCQSKIDYFAQALESHFTTVDFPGFFGINPSGSTAASSI